MMQSGYRETIIGEIPDDWEFLYIKDIILPQRGSIKVGPFGSQIKKQDLASIGHKLYGQENVINNDFNIGNRCICDKKFAELKSCELLSDDVVITMMGTGGQCRVVPKNIKKGIMDSHLLRIRCHNKKVYNYFLALLLLDYFPVKKQISRLSQGGVMAGLSAKIVQEIRVPVPSIEEQHHIVKILSVWNRAIEHTEKLIKAKRLLKKGLMQQLLTGKKRLKKFANEKWQHCIVKDFGKVITGTTPSKSRPDYYGKEFPWATAEDFNGKYIKNTVVRLSSAGKKAIRVLPKGSVLVTCIASIGKNAIAGCELATNQQINSIVVNKKYDNEFVFYLMGYFKNRLMAWAGVTAVPILNKKTFEKISFNAPPSKDEQRAISLILATVDDEIEMLQSKYKVLLKQKKGLMQKLLTGKLRVKV